MAALSLSVILAISPVASQAGLKEALNQVFVGTSTSGQTFETQRLNGVYGGSMTLRPIGKGISIVQLAAPRIDAGCGGIDIFFGSFSFVNGEQFEQLLRSLASSAVGFAIKSAIQAMCNPCAAIINELETAIRELNALAKNTCAIANAMFTEGGFEKLSERAASIGTHIANAAGVTADWATGQNNRTAQKPSETADVKTEENPMVGNLVYKAAKETLSNGTNTLSAFLTEEKAIEIVMGLYGTVIVLPGASNPPDGKTGQCGTDVPEERCDVPAEPNFATIPTWDVLFNPRAHASNGVPVWSCGGQNCTQPVSSTIPLSEWGGVQDAINTAMFGTADPSGPSEYTDDSIVGSILAGGKKKKGDTPAGTLATLSEKAKNFLDIAPMPIYRMLLEVQKSPGAVDLLGHQIAKALPDYLAYQLGVELLAIGKNVFTKQSKVSPPEYFLKELDYKSRSLSAFRPDPHKLPALLNDTVDSIVHIQRLTSSQIKVAPLK